MDHKISGYESVMWTLPKLGGKSIEYIFFYIFNRLCLSGLSV
jgi:hypothetical protein